MIYLTARQLLFIHARLITETGGAPGIRDLGLLIAAVKRPQGTFEGDDLYPDIHSKAAALMDSIVRNHPFVDGNRRTGITGAGIFLRVDGYMLSPTNDEVEAFTMDVARSSLTVDKMRQWFQSNTQIFR